MAWDLWSSSCDQVSYDGNCSERSEWQCDYFGFGCGRDAMEEDALNEESCVQVLRILITKADTEIEELEKDLLSLQNELAWSEHEKWPEICCSALTERINWLDVAVSTLKRACDDDTETQLLLHGKPAETLHEIVKALQRDHCQGSHGQHLDANILIPIVNVNEHALDKDSNNIDSNSIMMREEGKQHYETSENSRSSELLLELHEKRSDDPAKNEELLAISLVRSPDWGAIVCVPDHSDGMTLSETLDNKVTGNEGVRRSQLITTDTAQILNSLSSKGNGNISSEAKEENTIVKENEDDFRLATGLKGRKKYLHSKSGTAQQQKGGNSDLDKRLCDFAPKNARRACRKESKLAPDENLESTNLPLQVVFPQNLCFADTELNSVKGTNGDNSLQVINIENATLFHAENSALVSLLGIQTKSALYTGLQPTDEEKLQEQDLKSEIAANLSKSNMSFPSKLKAQGKQKPELEACSAREPLDSPAEFISNASGIVSTKRVRKSKTCTAGAILNEPMKRKVTKRTVQQHSQHETEGRAIVLYDSKFSELQKKRRVSKLPITSEIQNSTVNLDTTDSDRVPVDHGGQIDIYNSKSYSLVDSHYESSDLLPALKNLKMTNLRAMAKQHNISKYYKLTKGALVEQLVERLSSC